MHLLPQDNQGRSIRLEQNTHSHEDEPPHYECNTHGHAQHTHTHTQREWKRRTIGGDGGKRSSSTPSLEQSSDELLELEVEGSFAR